MHLSTARYRIPPIRNPDCGTVRSVRSHPSVWHVLGYHFTLARCWSSSFVEPVLSNPFIVQLSTRRGKSTTQTIGSEFIIGICRASLKCRHLQPVSNFTALSPLAVFIDFRKPIHPFDMFAIYLRLTLTFYQRATKYGVTGIGQYHVDSTIWALICSLSLFYGSTENARPDDDRLKYDHEDSAINALCHVLQILLCLQSMTM